MTYSNATHVCEVEVEIDTGVIHIPRYVIVEDCGTVLNPLIVEGQQHGATAMGLGGALYEHVVYDEQGQNLSGSFADYWSRRRARCRISRSCTCTHPMQ